MKKVELPKGPIPIPKRNKSKKEFLCIEHGEQFIIEADTEEEAREAAQMYGGELIGEVK